MKEQATELLAALDELDKIERDFNLNMLMHQEYRNKKNAALHRIDKARTALRNQL